MKVIAVLIGLYLALCLLARLSYRALLYPAPKGGGPCPADATPLTAKTSDGVQAHGWLFSRGNPTLVVLFHGNGETIDDGVGRARGLLDRGLDAMLVEYRGYGASPGSPTEEGLYADAEALLDETKVPRERVVLWGTSLGTGVATEMAKRGRGRALVLVAPFTSIPDIGQRVLPILPARLIVGDRYDSRAKASAIDAPVLILHGTSDDVVPYDMGVTLSRTFPRAKLLSIEGGHHNDLFVTRGPELLDAIARAALER